MSPGRKSTSILGISAFYHDSAAALVLDGGVVAAAQEERFTREKFDAGFPSYAISYCLREAKLEAEQIDYVAFYEKPLVRFERLLETYFAFAPAGLRSFNQAMPVWLKKKLFTRRMIRRGLATTARPPLIFLDHHESHAASAFFPSPFEAAAILTIDGVGEWCTAAFGAGRGNSFRLTHQLQFPHSLGLLYSAFTYYTGFTVNSGEYKLMGLAPFGQPVYLDAIYSHLIDLRPDGSLWLNMDYFNYCQGLTMTNRRFDDLFGGPPRRPDTPIERRHMDLAASIQVVTEEVVMRMARTLHRETGEKNLVLAGGVALNCVANGRLRREGPFENIWIQPAAGDAGGALGAALFVWHQLLEKPRHAQRGDSMSGSLLGPRYSNPEIETFLEGKGATFEHVSDEPDLLARTAKALADGKVVGWFQGRMEFGPRALGCRSILGDPRSAVMQTTMNVKIKFRESFRPFAPCVLREYAHEWFAVQQNEDAPYMLLVAPVLDRHRVTLSGQDGETLERDPDLVRRVNIVRSLIPAVTHVDYSARVQTVDERHGRFYRLLQAFHRETNCPIVVNTSFNLSWEPIVNTPEEAYRAFMQSEMDTLVLEDFILEKAKQRLGTRVWSTDGRADADCPWADPLTGEPLIVTPDAAINPATGQRYEVAEGIPRLFAPTGPHPAHVPERPDPPRDQLASVACEEIDTLRALLERGRADRIARLLNEEIPYDARVLEVGCGPGHLTNFLAIAHRAVVGVDTGLESLLTAARFKRDQGIERASFAHTNPLCPALREGFFDVVICSPLHYTAEAGLVFERISKLVRRGGHIVVRGRASRGNPLHATVNALSRVVGRTSHKSVNGAFGVDRNGTGNSCSFRDVLKWFGRCDFAFVNAVHNSQIGVAFAETESLFTSRSTSIKVGGMLMPLSNAVSGIDSFAVIGRREGTS